jgi:hypothetical protein
VFNGTLLHKTYPAGKLLTYKQTIFNHTSNYVTGKKNNDISQYIVFFQFHVKSQRNTYNRYFTDISKYHIILQRKLR